MTQTRIEDIVLRHDRRGISRLQPCLPAENYLQTAAYALERRGPVIIVTGFYVNGISETDGPPGALALAYGFKRLGCAVHLVTDRYCLPLFDNGVQKDLELIEFPITGEAESQEIARSLLDEIRPALSISVERCGQTRQGCYRNMRSVDISPYTARLDHFFLGQKNTIGIGDGGNEIGMGLLYGQIAAMPELIAEPTTTPTERLLIASVSNWAAYALLAALSVLSGEDIIPSVEEQSALLHEIVARGSIDGVTGVKTNMVDGFDEDVNDGILTALHAWVAERKAEG